MVIALYDQRDQTYSNSIPSPRPDTDPYPVSPVDSEPVSLESEAVPRADDPTGLYDL